MAEEPRVPRVEFHEDYALFVAHDSADDSTRHLSVRLVDLVKTGSHGELLAWANMIMLSSINIQLQTLNEQFARVANVTPPNEEEVISDAIKQAEKLLGKHLDPQQVAQAAETLRSARQ